MAEDFVGMLLEVTLKDKHISILRGRVLSVADSTITLGNVFFPKLHSSMPTYTLSNADIEDLQIVDLKKQVSPPRHAPFPSLAGPPPTLPDPAIMSFNRPSKHSSPRFSSAHSITLLQRSPVELSDAPPSAQPTDSIQHHSIRKESPREHVTASFTNQTPDTHRKKTKRRKERVRIDQNGWASEDANGIQEMPEFDFAANLSKFDKRTVFDQIRSDDMTADQDRLVSHNRLPKTRPGTYGGKNIHPTDNVLSGPLVQDSETQSDNPSDPGLQSPTPQHPKTAVPSSLSRQPSTTSPGLADDPQCLRFRPDSSLQASDHSRTTAVTFLQDQDTASCFRVKSNGQICRTISPSILRSKITANNSLVGLDAQARLEITARAIAQSITTQVARAPVPSRRGSRTSLHANGNSKSASNQVIVVVVGNHLRGAQTIAAVRQLYGRGYKILLAVPDLSTPELHQPQLAQQLSLLRALGKKTARIDGWHGISAQIKSLHSPPSLIVDALLDGSCYGAIKDASSALRVRATIDWVNRSRAPVLSIECPSGYDAQTAETTMLEGEPLAVIPDRVLALGAPVQGLLEAARDQEPWTDSISVVDVGLQPLLAPDAQIPFGATAWSVDLEFDA